MRRNLKKYLSELEEAEDLYEQALHYRDRANQTLEAMQHRLLCAKIRYEMYVSNTRGKCP